VPPVYVPERPPVIIPIDAGDNMFIQDAVQPSYDVPVIVKKTAKTVYLNTFVQPSFFDGYERFSSVKVFKEVIKKGKRTWVEVESISLNEYSTAHQLSMPRKKGRYKVVAIGAEGRNDQNLQWLKITKKKKNVVFLDDQGYNIPKPKKAKVKKTKKSKKKK